MVSVGEHELAKEMALKAIVDFKASLGEVRDEKLKEVEVELAKMYSNIAVHKTKESILNTPISIALKTIVVLLVISGFVGVGTSGLVGNKFNKMMSKIESGGDRRWNQVQAAI
jgi:hypothetical protein